MNQNKMKTAGKKLICAFFTLILSFMIQSGQMGTLETGLTALAAETEASATSSGTEGNSSKKAYTGWVKKNNAKYYYVKGKKITGWKKISGYYYYFNAKGKLQTNKIVGSAEDGYYYVDKKGIRVKDARIKAAVKYVIAHSDSSQTNRQRLKACYVAMYNNPYKRFYGDTPSAATIPSYAAYMFKHNTGNCYRYASAMAYIACVLGYESRVVTGGVNSSGGKYLSAHGWCEVKIGSTWRILDCSIQLKHKKVNLFLVTRKTYPYPLRWDKSYRMTVKNGIVTWK